MLAKMQTSSPCGQPAGESVPQFYWLPCSAPFQYQRAHLPPCRLGARAECLKSDYHWQCCRSWAQCLCYAKCAHTDSNLSQVRLFVLFTLASRSLVLAACRCHLWHSATPLPHRCRSLPEQLDRHRAEGRAVDQRAGARQRRLHRARGQPADTWRLPPRQGEARYRTRLCWICWIWQSVRNRRRRLFET